MLEKKLIDSFCDAHLHLVFSEKKENVLLRLKKSGGYSACTCAHSVVEFTEQEKLLSVIKSEASNCTIFSAFGLHPQGPILERADFLETLLKEKRISAIGEAGFDFYTAELKKEKERQEKSWRIQTELAVFYKVPLIIHCRKAMDFIFRDISILKKIPAVVFHSFGGAFLQEISILKKGVNAYFSFGKQILNGNKKAMECVTNTEIDRLLLETDAPYQTLKGEEFTSIGEIERVYEAAINLRNAERPELSASLQENFKRAFTPRLN